MLVIGGPWVFQWLLDVKTLRCGPLISLSICSDGVAEVQIINLVRFVSCRVTSITVGACKKVSICGWGAARLDIMSVRAAAAIYIGHQAATCGTLHPSPLSTSYQFASITWECHRFTLESTQDSSCQADKFGICCRNSCTKCFQLTIVSLSVASSLL